jgi:hypothetical protein
MGKQILLKITVHEIPTKYYLFTLRFLSFYLVITMYCTPTNICYIRMSSGTFIPNFDVKIVDIFLHAPRKWYISYAKCAVSNFHVKVPQVILPALDFFSICVKFEKSAHEHTQENPEFPKSIVPIDMTSSTYYIDLMGIMLPSSAVVISV